MVTKIKRLNEKAKLPVYASAGAAGMDIYNCSDKNITLYSGELHMFPTGLSVEIPEGFVGLLYSRSGLSTKRQLLLANGVGVIDSDYRGEIKVPLINLSGEKKNILANERIAQLIIVPYPQIEWSEATELAQTARGTGGFGSTGKE